MGAWKMVWHGIQEAEGSGTGQGIEPGDFPMSLVSGRGGGRPRIACWPGMP